MRKPIVQRHPSGCGIACAAQVLGSSYNKVLRLCKNGEFYAVRRGFYCKDIVKILKRGGKSYKFFYISKKRRGDIYHNGVIVFIARSRKYPQGHYLVRSGNEWMDSWINWPNITNGKAGFRKRLPGKPIYGIVPNEPPGIMS